MEPNDAAEPFRAAIARIPGHVTDSRMERTQIEELIERARNGGPRQRGDAWMSLRELAAAGIDLAPYLPAFADVTGAVASVEDLRVTCDVLAGRSAAVAEMIAATSHLDLLFGTLGILLPRRCPSLIAELWPALVARCTSSLDIESLIWTLRIARNWLWQSPHLEQRHVVALAALLADERKVKVHGQTWVVGAEAALALVPLARHGGDPSAQVAAAIADMTALNKAAQRGATYLRAAIAIAASDHRSLSALLDQTAAAPRDGASEQIKDEVLRCETPNDQQERAAVLLVAARELLTPRARCGLAEGIARALDVPSKPPSVVLAAIRALANNDPARRQEVGELCGLAIDQVDCRRAAPYLAASLSDENLEVRRHVANALYLIHDLTGDADIVRVTRHALEAAYDVETNEEVSSVLRSALAAATR